MMATGRKSKRKIEYGDFQTPLPLARRVCSAIAQLRFHPATVVEPTCGTGTFLQACVERFGAASKIIGFEINGDYLRSAASSLQDYPQVELKTADFFATDWSEYFANMPEPILVIGNPPWVTNAELASLGSSNIPEKNNFQKHKGFEAKTGKSNFDISEWMFIKLLDALQGKNATVALLVKTAVARRTLLHAWKEDWPLQRSRMFSIDAGEHFGVSVSACLLVCKYGRGSVVDGCEQFDSLTKRSPHHCFGFQDGQLVANVTYFDRWKHLRGDSPYRWRSGIKHDCAKVMEFRQENGDLSNGLGETVQLEDDYLFPLLKSSDVANSVECGNRKMLVTQRSIGEDTDTIRERAPKTWSYLMKHRDLLGKRGSSIYKKRPAFSIFGVGEYSFSPWKVAISGLYKRLRFSAIGPKDGKPTVLDDTCNLIPCESEKEARLIADMLNSKVGKEFFQAFIFWDAKRPITVDVLQRLDLCQLARELDREDALLRCRKKQPEQQRDNQGRLFVTT